MPSLSTEPGGPEVLTISELPDPEPGPGEVLIDVAATAVNRADLLQRQGFYPPPPGASGVIGLECSGTVAAVGEGVTGWEVGTPVCALLAGGGYSSRVVVPAGQVMPVPDGIDLVTAAALPEVACTVWSNVFMIAGLQPGDAFLVHGGAGGIGTMAVQLATALGARVFATAGSAEKLELCRSLGAEVAINYREEDFVDAVRAQTDGHGADVVLDNMGAKYLERNVSVLADEGRLVDHRHAGRGRRPSSTSASSCRSGAPSSRPRCGRGPVDGKAAICASVVEHVWPLVADGKVKPIVHQVLPLDQAAEAHRIVEAGSHSGKVLMTL